MAGGGWAGEAALSLSSMPRLLRALQGPQHSTEGLLQGLPCRQCHLGLGHWIISLGIDTRENQTGDLAWASLSSYSSLTAGGPGRDQEERTAVSVLRQRQAPGEAALHSVGSELSTVMAVILPVLAWA